MVYIDKKHILVKSVRERVDEIIAAVDIVSKYCYIELKTSELDTANELDYYTKTYLETWYADNPYVGFK